MLTKYYQDIRNCLLHIVPQIVHVRQLLRTLSDISNPGGFEGQG